MVPRMVRRQYFITPPIPPTRRRSARPGWSGRAASPFALVSATHGFRDVAVQAESCPRPILHLIDAPAAGGDVRISVVAAILERDDDEPRPELIGPYSALAAEIGVGRHRSSSRAAILPHHPPIGNAEPPPRILRIRRIITNPRFRQESFGIGLSVAPSTCDDDGVGGNESCTNRRRP